MRIISGTAKGRKLADFKGRSIRPTSDRVREAVFSSLFSHLGHSTPAGVLDLFAGTGAMGIEALSRGAEAAVLVDQSRESRQLISSNLATTGLASRATVLAGNVTDILPQLGVRKSVFELIFVDPPYADENIVTILQTVNDFGLLQTGGIMCVETAVQVTLPTEIGQLIRIDRRKYGSTAICYYQHKDTDA